MNFTEPFFLIILLLVLIVYYIAPHFLQPYILLAASILFYATWGMFNLGIVTAEVLIGWGAGLIISKKQGENVGERSASKGKPGKKCLFIAIFILIGVWIYGKSLHYLLSWASNKSVILPVIVPLGVSYYTLSIIGYLIDVYYGRGEAEKNFVKFLLFVIYFPKIIQGPIESYKSFGNKLFTKKSFSMHQICFGAQLFLYGLFKKIVLADRMALFLSNVFSENSTASGSIMLLGLFLRALHLYCDFSGYMDIAEGISEMFGIHMSPNFRRPFFSATAAEFWRRWHITLGSWFRDYVYMPVSISRVTIKTTGFCKKKFGKKSGRFVMLLLPLMSVWILTGIWHGTGINYVIWGLYWGVIILISSLYGKNLQSIGKKLKINANADWYRKFRVLRTFILFTVGRFITMEHPLYILRNIKNNFHIGMLFSGDYLYQYGLDPKNFMVLTLGLLLMLRISLLQEEGSVRAKIADKPIVIRWCIYYAAIIAILIFGMYGPGYDAASFIYMQY